MVLWVQLHFEILLKLLDWTCCEHQSLSCCLNSTYKIQFHLNTICFCSIIILNTSNADLCGVLFGKVLLETPPGGVIVSGGPTWKEAREGFVSLRRILFMSLTVSPKEKYSSRTSLAVLTRSKLAPVILNWKIIYERWNCWEERTQKSNSLPDTLIPDIYGIFIFIKRNTFSVRSDKSISSGIRVIGVHGTKDDVISRGWRLIPPDGLLYQELCLDDVVVPRPCDLNKSLPSTRNNPDIEYVYSMLINYDL